MLSNPFTRDHFEQRLDRTRAAMARDKLDLLILSAPESVYYLSGYQTRGISGHTYLGVPAEGPPVFSTRGTDLGNLYMIEDLTPIVDFVGFEDHDDPLQVFVDLLRRNRIGTGRLGVEKDAYFLSVRSYDALTAAFEGSVFCDASQIVEEQRLIKSAEEIACHREAGRIIVEATRAGIKSVKPGCTDGSIVTSVAGALIEAGSEYVATWPAVRTGAQSGRSHASWQNIPVERGQATNIETAGVVQRYHTPLRRAIIYGPTDEHRRIAETVRLANHAAIDALAPGAQAGTAFEAAHKVAVENGLGDMLSGRSGYTTGIGISPSWVQRMSINIVPGNETVLEPGMVFHVCTVMQQPNVFGVGESSTVVITEDGIENLTGEMEDGPFLVD